MSPQKAPRATFLRRASWWFRGGGYRLSRRDHRRFVDAGALRPEEVPALSAVVALGMLPGLRWSMAALYVLLVTDPVREPIPAWSRTVFAAVCFGASAAARWGLLAGLGATAGLWLAGMTIAGLWLTRARGSA